MQLFKLYILYYIQKNKDEKCGHLNYDNINKYIYIYVFDRLINKILKEI